MQQQQNSGAQSGAVMTIMVFLPAFLSQRRFLPLAGSVGRSKSGSSLQTLDATFGGIVGGPEPKSVLALKPGVVLEVYIATVADVAG